MPPPIDRDALENDHVAGKDSREAVVGYPQPTPAGSAEIRALRARPTSCTIQLKK